MSGFLAVCVRLSLHRGRGWEGEVSKWFFSVRVWFCQGVLSTIVKPRNVFQTRESQNSDKSVRNQKPR